MHRKFQEDLHQSSLESIVVKFTHERQRSTRRAINISLAELVPLESCHFDLAPSQFRDGLTIRYQRQSSCIPIKYDGCSANFTLQHALDCKTGGLVIQRHNKVRDCLGDMAAQVWSQVVREPIVKEAESKADGLRADLGIGGPQVEALFDIKVIDTDAPSHLH